MEKLIATCFLIVVMVGLSFGETNFRSPFVDDTPLSSRDNTPSKDEPNLPFETTNEPTTSKDKGSFYLIFPERVDSLKVPFDIQDGIYNYEDNTQTAKLTVKDNFVVALTVNDIDLKDEQLPNYKKLIDKIISTKAPQETTSSAAQNSDIQFDKNGMRINNAKTNLNVDKNGFALSATDDNGNSVNMNIDKNGLYVNATDNSGQPFKLRVDKNGLSMKSKKNSTYINGKVVTVYDANEHKWVVDMDENGGKIIKHYDAKGKFIEDMTTLNGKAYINGREASESELNERGWYFDGRGLQKSSEYEKIQSGNKENTGDAQSDIEGEVEELKNDMTELRQEIKDCNCTANFDFRMGLIARINNLMPALSSKADQSVYNDVEMKFFKIKNDWEKGECIDTR